ncbi:hypothetical protein [Pedobacter sp. N23S346]|uniref:hypothetical protein n=1 Tax=Pedobacter sp. N23S346 TaxID=3402750 RepID=UPI003AD639EB
MKPDIVPNYYAYFLKVNGKNLSNSQKEHFFNCINKIYKNNYKFIYRGDKKDKIQSVYGLTEDRFEYDFRRSIFVLGAKASMFIEGVLPGANNIDIAEAGNNEFRLIFRMLHNLLQRELPFGTARIAIKSFTKTEEVLVTFFRNQGNESVFIDIINGLDSQKQIPIRDYYLALLHHISKSDYYASSFLLSTTTSFTQANKFAWSHEKKYSNNPLILFGWLPEKYEGILNAPDSRILKRKIDMEALGLPFYEKSFFPGQQEITLKGGLLPHYLLGYLHNNGEEEVFEINPALFKQMIPGTESSCRLIRVLSINEYKLHYLVDFSQSVRLMTNSGNIRSYKPLLLRSY